MPAQRLEERTFVGDLAISDTDHSVTFLKPARFGRTSFENLRNHSLLSAAVQQHA
jgi:hypothetical protein